MTNDLTTDSARMSLRETGIYVRAKLDGHWDTVDIVHLDEPSLRSWLRSRGGENKWAEDVVCILLGHDR